MNGNYIREKPFTNLYQLLEGYGYNLADINSATAAAAVDLKFVETLMGLKREIEDNFLGVNEQGLVYGITAPWGTGKTSFVNILIDELYKSKNIESHNLCVFSYETLFYGNVSEAIGVLIENLFRCIEQKFAIRLRGVSEIIIKNLSPQVELSGFLPKVRLFGMQNRPSTELVLSEKVRDKLIKINGKIIIIIDDIDRLTSNEALHFLRLTRVLKELPNSYIILPVDKEALVRLLRKENIPNPGGYLAKIVDLKQLGYSIKEAQQFFSGEIRRHIPYAIQNNIEDLWYGYLWEVCLQVLRDVSAERTNEREFKPITMNTKIYDKEWSIFEAINSGGNENFIREFFRRTKSGYGNQTPYLIQQIEGESATFWELDQISDTATFVEFFNGGFVPRFGPASRGLGVFNLLITNSEPLIKRQEQSSGNITDPFRGVERQFAEGLNKVSLWSVIKDIPSIDRFFPVRGKPLIGGRIIKQLIELIVTNVGTLKYDLSAIENNTRGEIYRKYRGLLRDFVTNKSDISD